MEVLRKRRGFKMASHSLAVSKQEDDDDDVFPHRSSHSSLVTVLELTILSGKKKILQV